MKRVIITFAAVTLLIAGVLLVSNPRVMGLASGPAGRAFVEQPDGTFAPATEVRPDQRTIVPKRTELTKKTSGSSGKKSTDAKPEGSDAEWLSDFELTERSGKRISSKSFRGQPYVVGFFYATCPSICVRQNEKFKLLQDKFKSQPIRLVEITCDPEVDRPEVLAEYANRFNADPEQWLFFTGDMDYIERVGSEMFSIGIMRRGHPEKFALVDAQGKVYGLYTWSDAAQWQALQRDMSKLIAELPK